MFRRLAPMLIVPDVAKAASWYVDVLGARLRHTLPERPPYEWVSLYLGEAELMLAAGPPARAWYTDSVVVSGRPSDIVVYIYVDNARGLCEKVRRAADVIMEPVDQPYGIREFAVRDPFGFVLVFAEDLP